MQIIEDVNISPLLKAFEKFESFRINTKTEQEKAGTIQAFEYCFELTWKIMKRLLEGRGKIANSPRETFRMAALEGFISDPELWFDFLKKRNMTVHTYNQIEAEQVLSVCAEFSSEIKKFLINIGIKL
ncbi:MAG: nucleotidyltransferase substrate binding protein [Rickettsiaceae bacterium]|nr:nucleotidyltransferase substrate binding protein [Rickettsiaceae bacterium]